MKTFDEGLLKQLYIPPATSHKGQNGKLLIIGGSKLFHAASFWALHIASRVVDMVFYSSVPENNAIVHEAKKAFGNGIVVAREDLESYVEEADAILIGPGMLRTQEKIEDGRRKVETIEEVNKIEDEGEQTYYLTKYLLEKYPHKKWVIDAGALQMMNIAWLEPLREHAILTPHLQEFERLFGLQPLPENVEKMAREHSVVILLKGHQDVVCSPESCVIIAGGNAGMTKGGTGDVLAGLVGSLYTKNDAFLSAQAASYINKKAGESLSEKMGLYFNASDLADEIPRVMKRLLL